MFANFILHTVCHHLKRTEKIGEDDHIKYLPLSVQQTLTQMEKVAFDGLVKDKIVFTMDDLPDDDPTCYGLLQSVESYCSDVIGLPVKSLNFLHLGMQEYFAAKYVATLPKCEVYALLDKSLFVTVLHDYYYDDLLDDGITDHYLDSDSKGVRFSNMWIMYFGLTGGQCNALKCYVATHRQKNYIRPPVSQIASSQRTSTANQKASLPISQDILNDSVKVLYLFQCLQEAEDVNLCKCLSELFDSSEIILQDHRLVPHQMVSLGFFISMLQRNLKELNLKSCAIGDHGICLLHHYLCGNTPSKLEITTIDLSGNNFTEASSLLIGDIIYHIHPQNVNLAGNKITAIRNISTAVINTNTVKTLTAKYKYSNI
ncbi:uncharacterized protein [Dysidea avara]|uniref:uncharacterized protein isoform X1 n=1 Tax=Dysidea avara TaxID=196820 RepID=UPI00331798CC